MIMTKSLKLSFTDITSLDLIAIPVSFNSFVIYANVFRSFRRTHKIKKTNSQVSFPLFLFKCPAFLIAPAALSLCVMLTQSVLSGIWKENFCLPNPWFYPPLYPRAWVQSLWIPELFCITWTMVAFSVLIESRKISSRLLERFQLFLFHSNLLFFMNDFWIR